MEQPFRLRLCSESQERVIANQSVKHGRICHSLAASSPPGHVRLKNICRASLMHGGLESLGGSVQSVCEHNGACGQMDQVMSRAFCDGACPLKRQATAKAAVQESRGKTLGCPSLTALGMCSQMFQVRSIKSHFFSFFWFSTTSRCTGQSLSIHCCTSFT